MPELPEVETIKRQLARVLPGKKIRTVQVRVAKLIRGRVEEFIASCQGSRLTSLKRRAKILVFDLDNGCAILVHLKMTGQLVYQDKRTVKSGGHPIKNGTKDLPHKHTHVIFAFGDGSRLFFNDIRKFGYLQIIQSAEKEGYFEKLDLGVEPLSSSFKLTRFMDMLRDKPKARIKPLLMEQSFIAGVGNIYATEACYYASVRPQRRVRSLNKKEKIALYHALKKLLTMAIKKQGSSSNNYVDAYGKPGNYVPLLKVYGRSGERCDTCRTTIKSLRLAGRGTAYCPHCQH